MKKVYSPKLSIPLFSAFLCLQWIAFMAAPAEAALTISKKIWFDDGSRNTTAIAVYDGNTIILENGERIRLIGVDAPDLGGLSVGGGRADGVSPRERYYFAKQAKQFLEQYVFEPSDQDATEHDPFGKSRVLWIEEDETASYARDDLGRILANVYVKVSWNVLSGEIDLTKDSSEMGLKGHFKTIHLNAEMIKYGFALVDREYQFEAYDRFQNYEGSAKRYRKGLWRIIEGFRAPSSLSQDNFELL